MEQNLEELICNENDINMAFDKLQNTLINILDMHAPIKQKITKLNNFPCMTK